MQIFVAHGSTNPTDQLNYLLISHSKQLFTVPRRSFLKPFNPFRVDMTGGALIGRTPRKFCRLTAIIL
jgi:hypothetical protein